MNLNQKDAAVLYEGSKNCFGATGSRFLTFWPTAFSRIFLADEMFVKIRFLGRILILGSLWKQ